MQAFQAIYEAKILSYKDVVMVEVVQGRDVTLVQLIEQFGLQRGDDEDFFREWRDDLLQLSDLERQSLNIQGLVKERNPTLPRLRWVSLCPWGHATRTFYPTYYVLSPVTCSVFGLRRSTQSNAQAHGRSLPSPKDFYA